MIQLEKRNLIKRRKKNTTELTLSSIRGMYLHNSNKGRFLVKLRFINLLTCCSNRVMAYITHYESSSLQRFVRLDLIRFTH